VTINNLSGASQNVTISNIQNDDLKIFKLDNTDEIWWKTLPDMEMERAAAQATFAPGSLAGGAIGGASSLLGGGLAVAPAVKPDLKFHVNSGMGKGVYAINTSKSDLSFQLKIVKSGAQ
jgi:hypothetical protein